jgi:hypothetical protein
MRGHRTVNPATDEAVQGEQKENDHEQEDGV